MYNRLRRNFDIKVDTLKINVETLTGKLQELTESTNQAADDTNDSLNHTPPTMPLPTESTPLAKRIRKTLTPRTKSKVCKSLSVAGPSGSSKQYREQIRLNLSKIETVKRKLKSALCLSIEEFFNRTDVTKVCPDKKKVITDPFDPSVKVQIQYRMGYLQTLFEQYKAEVENECLWTSFK